MWYDPSDFSTLFQDSTGTVPVTAVEQPVGLMLDKSGYGNNAFQSTSTARPVLKINSSGNYFLLFDGADDSLRTNSVNFNTTDAMSVFAGVRALSDSGFGTVAELSVAANSNVGSFGLFTPAGSASNAYYSGGSNTGLSAQASRSTAPYTEIMTGLSDISTDTMLLRTNGVQTATNTSDQGTGNYGNYPLYIGRRAGSTLTFNGHLYSLIIVGKSVTASELTSTETWVNGKTGAY